MSRGDFIMIYPFAGLGLFITNDRGVWVYEKGVKEKEQVLTRPRTLISMKAVLRLGAGNKDEKKGYRSAPHDSQIPPFYPFLICH